MTCLTADGLRAEELPGRQLSGRQLPATPVPSCDLPDMQADCEQRGRQVTSLQEAHKASRGKLQQQVRQLQQQIRRGAEEAVRRQQKEADLRSVHSS